MAHFLPSSRPELAGLYRLALFLSAVLLACCLARNALPAASFGTCAAFCMAVFAAGAAASSLPMRRAASTPAPAAPRALHAIDPLTGLPDRLGFEQALHARIGTGAERHAVMTLDLDRFSEIADAHGDRLADAVLQEVARRLGTLLPPHAVIGRVMGDRFAAVVAITQAEQGQNLAQRLSSSALHEPILVHDQRVHLSMSIGYCITPDDADLPEDARRRADLALRRGKSTGRGSVSRFEPFMEPAALRRVTLETDLHGAIARGELFLEYQPIFGTQDGALAGFEALLRWQHPTRGLIPPLQFVSLAEQTGIIREIGAWVLAEACREAMRWPEHLHIAVNVSAAQLQFEDLTQTIQKILTETGLAPHRLDLELTESVLLANHLRSTGMLRRLAATGVPISMDDFGTGYCSLDYLRQFPFGRLKIDRAFVRDMVNDPATFRIVEAITRLSESLGISVTAEGVETTAQSDLLRTLSCDRLQGYLLGRPGPIARYAQLIASARQAILPDIQRAPALT